MVRDIQVGKGGRGHRENETTEAELSSRLTRLNAQLSKSRELHEGHDFQSVDNDELASLRASGMALGFRLSSEFVAAVVVGGAIGWTMDHFLPTSPWGLIVFVMVGFAAGLLRLIRDVRPSPR